MLQNHVDKIYFLDDYVMTIDMMKHIVLNYDEAKRKSDLHGQLGSSLISVALDNINKAMVFNSTKGDTEALANLYKTKEDTADVQNELNEVKNQNTNLGINQ